MDNGLLKFLETFFDELANSIEPDWTAQTRCLILMALITKIHRALIILFASFLQDTDGLLDTHISLIDRGTTLLSYMAFSLVIGTLCQFKCFVTMKTEHPNYMYILVSLILTLAIQSIVAVILLYTSKREPIDTESTMTFYLTLLIATVTFINIVVFILV